jgi:hypothetical protein
MLGLGFKLNLTMQHNKGDPIVLNMLKLTLGKHLLNLILCMKHDNMTMYMMFLCGIGFNLYCVMMYCSLYHT